MSKIKNTLCHNNYAPYVVTIKSSHNSNGFIAKNQHYNFTNNSMQITANRLKIHSRTPCKEVFTMFDKLTVDQINIL